MSRIHPVRRSRRCRRPLEKAHVVLVPVGAMADELLGKARLLRRCRRRAKASACRTALGACAISSRHGLQERISPAATSASSRSSRCCWASPTPPACSASPRARSAPIAPLGPAGFAYLAVLLPRPPLRRGGPLDPRQLGRRAARSAPRTSSSRCTCAATATCISAPSALPLRLVLVVGIAVLFFLSFRLRRAHDWASRVTARLIQVTIS